MRIARFTAGEEPQFAAVGEDREGNTVLAVLDGDPLYRTMNLTGEQVPLEDARLVSPVIPRSKLIGVGRNYAEHAAELGHDVPENPLLFLMPNTSVIGPNEPIVVPDMTTEVHHEAELAVVIGRIAKDVPAERASEVIFGYTCANDVTARDLQRTDGQWARAKGFDTFNPIGPWIETDLDIADVAVRCRVDGESRQDGRTSQMVRGVPELIEYISAAFTLLPGDIILTGTPAGVGPIRPGQHVTVSVEGIGVLSNPVVNAADLADDEDDAEPPTGLPD